MSGLKRIFINARFLTQSITGVQRYAHELVKALDVLIDNGEINKTKYRLELLSPRKGLLFEPELKHIPLRRVGSFTGHAWEQFELPFYSKGGLLFCPGNTAPLLSLRSGQTTVVTVHSLSFLYFPEAYSSAFRAFYKFIVPQALRFGDAVITVSQAEKDLIEKTYDGLTSRLYAIQNGAISKEFKELIQKITPSERTSQPFVLFVGSLSKGKNLQGAMDAISVLNKSEDISLVVVGAGGNTFNSAELGITEEILRKVHFKGQINDTGELIGLYKTALCLVFPSFYEASSLPPIEAMACGCPVIASSIPALIERCGDAALYCNPQNTADIGAKIEQIIRDSLLRETLQQKGFAHAQKYTWDNCARETFRVIERVIAK